MPVREVDPLDEASFGRWAAVVEASLEDERPGEPTPSPGEELAAALSLLRPGAAYSGVLLTATRDSQAVGAARLRLPERDNRHLARLDLHVHPGWRRRGVGGELLDAAVGRARAAGRTVLTLGVDEPGPDAPGRAFALAVGATQALTEVRRDLDLPVSAVRLDALESAARLRAGDYEVVGWRDRTPEHWRADRAELARRMSSEYPYGDLPLEEEVWDVGRLQQDEDGAVRQGRTWWTAAAAYGGRLVAFTCVGVPLEEPVRAYQWDTLVLPEHQGHRLGLLLKVSALRALQAASPATRLVSTWNADVNAPMIAVNEALGYRPAGGTSLWSLELAAPVARTGRAQPGR